MFPLGGEGGLQLINIELFLKTVAFISATCPGSAKQNEAKINMTRIFRQPIARNQTQEKLMGS